MKAQNPRTAEDEPREAAGVCDEAGETDWVTQRTLQTAKGQGWSALRASHQRRHLNGGASYDTHRPTTSANKQPRTRPRRPRREARAGTKGSRWDKTDRNDTRKNGQHVGVSRQKERGPAGLKAEDRARTGPVPCSRVTWVVYLLFRSDGHSRKRRFPDVAAAAAVKPDIHCVVPDCASWTG